MEGVFCNAYTELDDPFEAARKIRETGLCLFMFCWELELNLNFILWLVGEAEGAGR